MNTQAKEFAPGRGYSKEDWDEVADAPELTDEQGAQRMTIEEAERRHRGKGKKPAKRAVTIRLDPEVIEAYKADGPGWHAEINEVLRKAKGMPERA